MKAKIIRGREKNQALNQLRKLLGFKATIADLKILQTYRIAFNKFPKVFPADHNVGMWAGNYDRKSVLNCKKKAEGKVLDWTRKDHAPTPTYFWLLDDKATEEFRKLFLIVFGFLDIKILRNPHHQINFPRLLKQAALVTAIMLAPDSSGTPRRPSGMTWGEIQSKQYPGILPDGSKNSLTKQDFDSIYNMRPALTGQVSRSGYEATTQEHQRKLLKQERDGSKLQSDTGLHSRDYRTVPVQVGSDQACGVPASGDSPSTSCAQAQQTGQESLWPILQCSTGILQGQQSAGRLAEDRFPERDLQDARECSDVAGYEGDWEEVYD